MKFLKKPDGLWDDATLYIGMFANLDSRFKKDLLACLDVNGQLWRNPEAAEAGVQYRDSCSRDILNGFLLGASDRDLLPFFEFLRKNKWRLCPSSSGTGNLVGPCGAIEILWRIDRSFYNFFSVNVAGRFLWWILPFVSVVEAVTARKGYRLHQVMVDLLRYQKYEWDKHWLTKHAFKASLRICELRSPGNAVTFFLKKDLVGLKKRVAHLRYFHNKRREYQDVWPFATFESWRAPRIMHPSAFSWAVLAQRRLEQELGS